MKASKLQHRQKVCSFADLSVNLAGTRPPIGFYAFSHFLCILDISSGDEALVMGLIWLLILKYQNINRTEQLGWIKSQLQAYGINISDLTTSFQDGMAFGSLVHSFKNDAINLDELKSLDILERLDAAFGAAETSLGIPRLLEPSDCYPDKPNERIIMTYVFNHKNLPFLHLFIHGFVFTFHHLQLSVLLP